MKKEAGKNKFPIDFEFLFMNHWGSIYILPCMKLCVNYSMPTLILQWWVFRLDVKIYKYLPNWFMKYVWSPINFDFIKKKKYDK